MFKKVTQRLAKKMQLLGDYLEPKIVGKRQALNFGLICVPFTVMLMSLVHRLKMPDFIFSTLAMLLLLQMLVVLAWLALEADTLLKKIANGFLFASLGFEFVAALLLLDDVPSNVAQIMIYKTVVMFLFFGWAVTVCANIGSKKKIEPIRSL